MKHNIAASDSSSRLDYVRVISTPIIIIIIATNKNNNEHSYSY